VHQSEDQRQRALIVWRLLKLHQGDIQISQAFVGLGQEIGNEIVHGSPFRTQRAAGRDAILTSW
jgi:hypothetical protein